jgi:hypothetical protein
MPNRDYFKDDEEYEDTKSYMYKLKILEELSFDRSDETFIGSELNDED